MEDCIKQVLCLRWLAGCVCTISSKNDILIPIKLSLWKYFMIHAYTVSLLQEKKLCNFDLLFKVTEYHIINSRVFEGHDQ